MAFIDIAYLQELGYRIPQSSTDSVTAQLNKLIEDGERVYFQNTIGYQLTTDIYALISPLPPEVDIFLYGNLVDGDAYYRGVLVEIAAFIMAEYYGEQSISVNNSGLSEPLADGEKMVASNFVVNTLINHVHRYRPFTKCWLTENNIDFFAAWEAGFFNPLDTHSVW